MPETSAETTQAEMARREREQVNFDWESRIQKEQMKISDIFSKLSGGRGISSSEAKVMYIKKARNSPCAF